MNYYCTYYQMRDTKIIFNVGTSMEQVIDDAKQYADTFDNLLVARCTKELYDYEYSGKPANNVIRNDAGLLDLGANE